MASFDTVQVCVDLECFVEPALMGSLECQNAGTGEVFSFEYDRSWLQRNGAAKRPD